jgi:hypothetical protein
MSAVKALLLTERHEHIHRYQSNLIPLDPEAFIQTALELLASDRYLAWAWMALTGRRPAEIFFSAKFTLPRKKLPYPALIFDGQLENPPGSRHQFRALPHPPFWPIPRNLSRPSILSGISRASLLPRPLTPPPARSSPSTCPPPSAPSTYHGNPATCEAPTAPSVATASNPKTRPTGIFLAKILGHKLLGPNASLSVGQSYKDFYIR